MISIAELRKACDVATENHRRLTQQCEVLAEVLASVEMARDATAQFLANTTKMIAERALWN